MTISVNLTDTPVGVTVSANAGSVSVSAATVTAVQVGIAETAVPYTHGGTHAAGASDPVTLAVSQVTGLQTALDGKASSSDSRLSDARTPTSHAASHAAAGSDPITVGTVSGRIVTTTTGGKLSTGTLADVVSGQSIAPVGLTVSPPNVTAGNYPADLIPFSITYDAASVFQVNAVGDVGCPGVIEAGSFSGAIDATNLTGTIPTARLASGTASASTYLRGDQTWASITVGQSQVQSSLGNSDLAGDLDEILANSQNASNLASGTLNAARLPASAREAAESFIHPFLLGGL